MSQEELEEDILELLCSWKKKKQPLRPEAICLHFQLERSELEEYLRLMFEHRYIEQPDVEDSGEIGLTSYGYYTGSDCIYRHHSISQHLQSLGVSLEVAEKDACRMEHVMTDESINAICRFANYGATERKIVDSNLTNRYGAGEYRFTQQMYELEHVHPRKLTRNYRLYQREILLKMEPTRSVFELQRIADGPRHPLWYRNREREWIRAHVGEYGEEIPANVFEFILKSDDRVMTGNVLIAFMDRASDYPIKSRCIQLEVELW